MADHTPGPWVVNDELKNIRIKRLKPPNYCVAIIPGVGLSLVKRKANAQLIAAAPELLAALEGAVARITDDHECMDCGNPVSHDADCLAVTLGAAIAKAKGT